MYGSFPAATATSKGLKLPHPPTAAFGSHLKEDVESELLRHRDHHHHQQHQMSSSLLRFRSAPSSLLGELCDDSLLSRPAIAGAVNKFAGFLTPDPSPQFRPPPSTQVVGSQQKAAFSSAPPMMYHHSQQQQLQMHLPNQSLAESSHRAAGLMPTEMQQVENGGGNRSSNLTRQSSSPAGLFSHLNVDNGYAMMRGLGGFRNEDLLPIRDAAKRQNSVMSQISEMGSEEISRSNPDEDSGCGRGYIPGVPVTSWEETSLLSGNNFSGIRIGREGEGKIVSGLNLSEPQNNGEMRNHVSDLTHQLSLPKTSATAIENFLQFQDAIPCRVRAKRGCATHPRSIAERVRRTKISERMRKLQELVPNMDKQTNTADMLDLSVDYIKDLQKQVKALKEIRASCTCSSSKQKFSLSS